MKLKEGKLYNVFGIHIYGAGDDAKEVVEFWNQIMYVQKENIFQDGGKVHVFLADGEQHGGFIDKEILTRVKVPFRKFRLIGDNILTNKVLNTRSLFLPPDEHSEGIIKFLKKAEIQTENLPIGEKRERYRKMIANTLYNHSKEENLVITVVKDTIQKISD